MIPTPKTEPFENYTDEYEAWFEKYPEVFESEVNALGEQLPASGRGIEVGIGTGRYALALGIKEGVEPADNMRALATKKGLDVMDASAEHLPYKDMHFDFVLMVTICHFDDINKAFSEAYRVLKPNGVIVAGMLDKDRPVAKSYEARRKTSHFYKHATFYSVQSVEKALINSGFKNLSYIQTLFQDLKEIKEPEPYKEGYGDGSYVVIKGIKNK